MTLDIPEIELTLVLTFLGGYLVTHLYKVFVPSKPISPVVINGLVSLGVGAGVTLLAQGASVERVLVGVAAAVISAVAANRLHAREDVGREARRDDPGTAE